MNIWRRVLQALGLIRRPERRIFALDERTGAWLQTLAEREQRPAAEMATHLLTQALYDRQAAETELVCWRSLTPREQQVTALICLGYINRQIALQLEVSPNTVKTHVSSVLHKFGVPSRQELRRALEGWDFGGWEKSSS